MPRPKMICRDATVCTRRKTCLHAVEHEDKFTDCWPGNTPESISTVECPGCQVVGEKDQRPYTPYQYYKKHQKFEE